MKLFKKIIFASKWMSVGALMVFCTAAVVYGVHAAAYLFQR